MSDYYDYLDKKPLYDEKEKVKKLENQNIRLKNVIKMIIESDDHRYNRPSYYQKALKEYEEIIKDETT